MPKRLSPELRERLERQQVDNPPPLPVSYFVCVHSSRGNGREKGSTKCYSTFEHPVTVSGMAYTGEDVLLDFDGNSDKGFLWNRDDLHYGASCGFRVFDKDGFIDGQVRRADRTEIFPEVYIEAWVHFSVDVEEIESMVYCDQVFGGFGTRIEMGRDERGIAVAKVWGGHEGIAVSKLRANTPGSASVVGRRIGRRAGE